MIWTLVFYALLVAATAFVIHDTKDDQIRRVLGLALLVGIWTVWFLT